MHFDDAADDQVADLGRIARAEWADGQELVGFEEGAGDGGEDLGGGGVGVGSVAAVGHQLGLLRMAMSVRMEGGEEIWHTASIEDHP